MVYITIIFLIILVDAILKEYTEKYIKKGQVKLICKDKIIVTKSYNEGAALRLLEEHPLLLKCISGGILIFLCLYFIILMRGKKNRSLKIALSFILGGGLSNYIDRFIRGYVVDYFTFARKDKKIGKKIIFNLSDFCIFFGSAVVALREGIQFLSLLLKK